MPDRRHELAEELWDLLAADVDRAQNHPESLAAKLAAARATKAMWDALGEAHAGRHKDAARDAYLNPPVSPG